MYMYLEEKYLDELEEMAAKEAMELKESKESKQHQEFNFEMELYALFPDCKCRKELFDKIKRMKISLTYK